MRASGIQHYRLEFVHETARDVRRVVSAFQDYFADTIDSKTLDQRLTKIAPQGISEGSLFVPADTVAIQDIL
jgi:putative protease